MDQPLKDHKVRALIALPLQIGRGATGLGLRVAGQAAGVGMRALGRLISAANRGPSFGAVQDEEVSAAARVDVAGAAPETPPAPPPAPDARAAEPADTAEPELGVVPTAAPAHVSEQPELVASYAEPGAEDGPGASVHVVEPWKGYGHMTADDVVARLAAASREELVAVELYERLHRGRRTVLTAAGRQLRRASAPSESR
jgi:hypothetical protein